MDFFDVGDIFYLGKIVENKNKTCLIKSLPTELEQNFETLFRRVFLILLQQLEDLGEILDLPKELKTFYNRDFEFSEGDT